MGFRVGGVRGLGFGVEVVMFRVCSCLKLESKVNMALGIL